MKKIGRMVLATLLVAWTLCGGLAGCASQTKKAQLFIGVYDGGVGTQWAYNLKQKFEEKYANVQFDGAEEAGVVVEIVPKKQQYDRAPLIANIQSGNEKSDIYYTADANHYDFYRQGVCADITTYLNEKVYDDSGEFIGAGGTKSILDKMDPYYVRSFRQSDGKYFAVPFEDSLTGFVYDHDLFASRGWLGRWGASHTEMYPQTVDEFFSMLELAYQGGVIPLTYAPYDAGFYTFAIIDAITAQYEGVDDFNEYWGYYGGENGKDYTFAAGTFTADELEGYEVSKNDASGQTVKITEENAYLLTQMTGRRVAVDFAERLFGQNLRYIDGNTKSMTQSFSETQSAFVMSGITSGKQPIGMIVEGEWWENEARQAFEDSRSKGEQYGYGKRDFRYMPLPKFDGQKEEGTVIGCHNAGSACFISEKSAHKDLAALWLQFSLSESALEAFTLETGCQQGYKFDLSEQQQNSLTKFSKNVYDIKHGNTNMKVGRITARCDFAANNALHLNQNMKSSDTATDTESVVFNVIKDGGYSTDEIMKRFKHAYNKAAWMTEYNAYKGVKN